MGIDQLKLQVGDALQLQTMGDTEKLRFHVRLIGYLPGHSLVVTAPRVEGKVALVREGQTYAVRLMVGNRVVGFTSRVLRTNMRPYPYVHLSYPDDVESIVVRRAPRVKVAIVCAVRGMVDGEAVEPSRAATMVDLSVSGTLLKGTQKIAEVGSRVQISARFEAGSVTRDIRLQGSVANLNVAEDDNGRPVYLQGVEFVDLDEQADLILHAFLYEHLSRSITS